MKNVNEMSGIELVQEIKDLPTFSTFSTNMEKGMRDAGCNNEKFIKAMVNFTKEIMDTCLMDVYRIDELRDMVGFYRTPLGKRMLDTQIRVGKDLMPLLQSKTEKYVEELSTTLLEE